jgi:tetratricopeptide (TPR) repeat protein
MHVTPVLSLFALWSFASQFEAAEGFLTLRVLQIGKYQDAEADCTAALLGGPNVKALLRRGTARSLLGMDAAAMKDFQLVLNLEPNNS